MDDHHCDLELLGFLREAFRLMIWDLEEGGRLDDPLTRMLAAWLAELEAMVARQGSRAVH